MRGIEQGRRIADIRFNGKAANSVKIGKWVVNFKGNIGFIGRVGFDFVAFEVVHNLVDTFDSESTFALFADERFENMGCGVFKCLRFNPAYESTVEIQLDKIVGVTFVLDFVVFIFIAKDTENRKVKLCVFV